MASSSMKLSRTIDIDAPPGTVWKVMTDVERWPEWTASVTSIQRLEDGPLVVGSTARVKQPRLLPTVFTVTAVDDRSFTWVTRSAGVAVTAWHVVEPSEHGSRATLALEFSGLLGRIVGRLTRSLTTRYVGLEAEGLKRRSEELHRGAAPSTVTYANHRVTKGTKDAQRSL